MSRPSHHIPVIDLSAESDEVLAQRLDAACRDRGFFVVTGHGVRSELIADLEAVARAFFALDPEVKSEIAMDDGGKAWRGWFALGSELTAGRPDHKEGIYFGSELPADDPRPLHGPNLFPSHPAEMRDVVLEYIEAAAAGGSLVLIGDPQRNYFPKGRFDEAARYEVPVTRELEDAEIKRTAVWRLGGSD